MSRAENLEISIDNICSRFSDNTEPMTSRAYGDGADTGPLFPRLQRAALNQVDNGDAMYSRYAIWANTARDNIANVLESETLSPDARRKLIESHNSLSAFCEIQALFDPLQD